MIEGWQEVSLGELATIISGKSNTKDAVSNGEYAFFDRSKKPKRSSRYLFDKCALIIPGEGKEFHPRKFSGKFDLHQRAYAIFDFDQKVSRDFVFYALENDHKRFERVAVGATVKSLRQRHFDKFPIPLPPLEEQIHIVAVLDEAFSALERSRKNTEANLQHSKIMASLVFDQILANQKQLSWVELQAFCQAFQYGTSSKSFPEGTLPVLRMGNIQSGSINWEKLKFSQNAEDNDKYLLKDGDVLFNRTNSAEHVGKSAIYRGEHEAIYAGYLVRVVYDKSKIDGEFLNQFLNGNVAKSYGASVMSKSVNQANISAGKLKKYPFPNLSLKQQREISDRVFSIANVANDLVDKYQSQLNDIDDLRQSLLQRAFAGELTQSTPILAVNDNERDERLSTATLVLAFEKHLVEQRHNTFGHVKAQKTLHLTESIGGLDLGRQPQVRQAGPFCPRGSLGKKEWCF